MYFLGHLQKLIIILADTLEQAYWEHAKYAKNGGYADAGQIWNFCKVFVYFLIPEWKKRKRYGTNNHKTPFKHQQLIWNRSSEGTIV